MEALYNAESRAFARLCRFMLYLIGTTSAMKLFEFLQSGGSALIEIVRQVL